MYKEWHSKEYEDIIDNHSSEWDDLCRRRLLVDDQRCVYCGTPAFMTRRRQLAVHHIDYKDPNLLSLSKCVSICDRCHGILHSHILPRDKDIDPRSEEVQEKVRKYMEWTEKLIRGEVYREESLVPGNCGPDAYKQYAGKDVQNT